MRKLFLLSLICANTAFATNIKNEALLKACKDKGVAGQNFCYGFIVSAANGAQYYRNLVDAQNTFLDICFPPAITNKQIVDVYIEWLKKNPSVLNGPAFIGVTTALSTKYSCGQKKVPAK